MEGEVKLQQQDRHQQEREERDQRQQQRQLEMAYREAPRLTACHARELCFAGWKNVDGHALTL
jgi:hypothetical protein